MNKKNNYLTTREKAIKWWNNLSIVEKAYKLSASKDKYFAFFEGRRVETLTGREIEMIYSNFHKKTHLVIDETDNNSSCLAGTLDECNKFISEQNTFGFKVVPMTKQELEIYNH
jgi:hypothetical protein